MPNSIRENDADVQRFVTENAAVIKRVLDVGPGEGTYHRLLAPLVDEMDAVEIWEPNIELYGLRYRYNNVTLGDIRDYEWPDGHYDMVIFGDVLEHLTVPDALSVFNKALASAKCVLVSVPIVHFPQGSIAGNHAETHLIEDPQVELIPFMGIPLVAWRYEWTGTFIYVGNN